MTALCPETVHWASPSRKMESVGAPDDSGLSFSNFTAPPGQYLFISDMGQPDLDKKPGLHPTDTSLPNGFHHGEDPGDMSSMVHFAAGSAYPSQASFTATNAHGTRMQDALELTTISPLQTRFHGDPVTYDSYRVDASACSATSTEPSQWSCNVDRGEAIERRRCESIGSQVNSAPCVTRSPRTSDKAEHGLARAVYLEKNRQAASKCRTKQKRQQEDLVETAREVERKNKVLKSEVELLKSDLRELMELVGRHNECPDGRLRRYIQLEADRLSARGDRSPIAELLSSKGSSSEDSALRDKP